MTEYLIYRDSGTLSSTVTNLVHYAQTQNLFYLQEFTVTDFPALSGGNSFAFEVHARTSFGESTSLTSARFVLAGVPDKPSVAPTRNLQSSEFTIACNIVTVPGSNGSPITSFNVEIDDGYGGPFVELKG